MKTYNTVATETDINGVDSNEELTALFAKALELCQTAKTSQAISGCLSSSTQYLSLNDVTYCIHNTESVDLNPIPLPEIAIDFNKYVESVQAERDNVVHSVNDAAPQMSTDEDAATVNQDCTEDTANSAGNEDQGSMKEQSKHYMEEYSTFEEGESKVQDAMEQDNVQQEKDIINTPKRPHQCGFCEKKFTKNQILEEHLQIHTGERPHRCELCNKAFATKGNLSQHLQTHDVDRSHKCELCDKTFLVKASLQRHLQIHTGEKPHKCELCNKSFALKDYLQKHSQIHNCERPQKCEYCEKTFKRRDDLAQHLKIHTRAAERPYQCEYCKKAFLRKENLKEHLRIHTGEKPLKCTYCDRTFRFRTALKRHVTQHND